MDNNIPLQFGSGGAALGGSAGVDALNQAIQRRQTGQSSPTQAVSPGSPTFDPTQVAPQLPNPQASPASTVPSSGAPAMDLGASLGMGASPTSMENELIIKALDSKLKSNASIEKSQAGGF